ncbi:acetyl-coenzyme A transporter 1 isoform 2-T2 [Dama dama]|uniref:acetyl-coenzyme A transporter 1 isoform X2 n=1 Tax=Cervus elaphus TaxID=9860 RepID=UPI0018B8D3ED|nr:acetyl-coenzyme A transporter 1 isoform X2 [Cervus elaphus]XP_061024163.1 acetyl-coenzyme A transporter 1 isoform X2 [Dama dama]
MSPTVSHKDNSRQRRPGTFNHSLDLKSGPLPPGSWDDNLPEVVGGEGDKEALLRDISTVDFSKTPRSCRAELSSILLLLFLYVLQGIPLGLAGSIPLILQSKNVSYTDQAFFSFVFWPFSLKLLWAPLVDAVYFKNFGRRKSWLVPTQYILGFFMIYLSTQVDHLLGNTDGRTPDVVALTVTFFLFEFLAATQDIAVDGWALTMLSRENVGYASTCNSVGQTAGYFLGNVLFLALESADFCNKYLRFEPQPRGIVTLSDWFFSSRCSNRTEIGRRGSTQRTFSLIGSSNGSFANNTASDYQQIHCRSPATKHILQSHALQVTLYSMYVSIMAFNAKVSDPLIGGTYMTLLNTVSNLGGNWPSTVALWLVDPLTVKECVGASNQNCRTPDAVELCKKLGGSCVTALDGYYVESVICVLIGFGWWFFLGPKLKKLQDEGPSSWKCKRNK